MTAATKLKDVFDVASKHGAFYTGGNIQWYEDTLYCQTESSINLLNVETGLVVQSIGDGTQSEEIDIIQTFTTDGNKCISSHKSGLLKLWDQSGKLEKMWKYIHKGPVAKLKLNGNRLASGGSDSIVRIWDLQFQACLLSLKGCQGVVNLVEYHPDENALFASADDGKINCYELEKGELITVHDAHFSKVTSLTFANDKKHFMSCGRDKVIVLWQFNKSAPLKTIAVYEAIEVIVTLPVKFKLPGFKPEAGGIYVASAGENGVVRVWDVEKSKEVFVQSNSLVSKATEDGGLAVTNLMYNKQSKSLAVVTVDHNIVIHHLKSFVCTKQFIGFSDEILDIVLFGKNDSHIAVATNSADIKLYDNQSMGCQLLKGHEDLVLSLNVSPADRELMVSSGKDNSVRVWKLENAIVSCIAVGNRHTSSVGSVCFFSTNRSQFVSASQDTCLKLWELPDHPLQKSTLNKAVEHVEKINLNCKQTVIAHQKDINCVAVSPNDKIVASASQDKTVKLWTADNLELVGILKGHKRGVWSVRFSPVDQVVVTSSADCTIKLWSVANLSCLKTLEGHESSVLKAEFISKGMQILSAGADGLIKLFNLKNSECQYTMDQHEGRIWAMAIKSDESGFITGGSDSYLIKWKDVTEERKQQQQKEMEELALEEQKLSNYIQGGQLLKALKLALRLERPFQTLKIIQGIIKKGDTEILEEDRTLSSILSSRSKSAEKSAFSLSSQTIKRKLNDVPNDENASGKRKKLDKQHVIPKVKESGFDTQKKSYLGLVDTVKSLRNDQKESLLNCALNWNTNSRHCQAAQLVLNILINELQTGEFRPVGLSKLTEGMLPYTERHFKRLTQTLQDLHFLSYTVNCMQPHARNLDINIGE